MPAVNRFDMALQLFMDNYMRGVYSLMPCEVIAVDYSVPSVDLKPLIYDVDVNGQTVPISNINDVPLFVFGDGSSVRITVPVKVGTRVACLLSDSDTSNVMINPDGSQPVRFQKRNDMYPLMAIPTFFTPAKPKAISSTDIAIENGASTISVKPDGNILANGCNITPDGNVITKHGTDLDQFYADYLMHTHGGVDTGSGNTQVPN